MQITRLASLGLSTTVLCTLDQLTLFLQTAHLWRLRFSPQTLKIVITYRPLKTKEKNRTTNGFLHRFFVLFTICIKFLTWNLRTWHSANLQGNKSELERVLAQLQLTCVCGTKTQTQITRVLCHIHLDQQLSVQRKGPLGVPKTF